MTSPRSTDRALRINSPCRPYFILSLVLLALPQASFAQEGNARVVGRVTASDSQHPLPNTHVFIASSLIGTTTDADGRFELINVPAGAHHLVVSMVGYAPYERDSLFRAATSYSLDIELDPATIALEEIVVSAREARRWQRRFIKFTRLFLGETSNSEFATIENPEVLSFTAKLGRLSATASAPLIIENRALGYQLQYFLKEFVYSGNTVKYDGDPLFKELEPYSEEEAMRWAANREAAFYGSQRHYFLALLDQRTDQESFVTYRRFTLGADGASFLVDPGTLLRGGPTPLERELTFSGFLEIVYTGEKESPDFRKWLRYSASTRLGDQRSFIKLNDGPTLIDQAGEVIDPYGITAYGYFAYERIGDLMPKEYRPSLWIPYSPER